MISFQKVINKHFYIVIEHFDLKGIFQMPIYEMIYKKLRIERGE